MQTITGFRLSPQQERLWRLQRSGGNLAFQAGCAVLIEGKLHKTALRAALTNLIERHEILRTTFYQVEGMILPLQVISDSGMKRLPECDLSSVQSSDFEWEALFEAAGLQLFDLERDAAVRPLLLTISQTRHILILHIPALCADATTLDIIVDELSLAYSGRAPVEEEEGGHLQYADLAEWQIELLESEESLIGRGYWEGQDISPALSLVLPFENRRGPLGAFNPKSISTELPEAMTAELNRLARKFNTDVSSILQTCWGLLLWRLTNLSEIGIGVVYDGRLGDALQKSPGLFSKVLPLIFPVRKDQSFGKILEDIIESSREAAKWQECFRWEKSVKMEGADPGVVFFPVCFESRVRQPKRLVNGVSFSIYKSFARIDRCNLKLSCTISEDSVRTEFCYEPGLFSPATVRRLAGQLHALIGNACASPESLVKDLGIISHAERDLLIFGFNDTASPYPENKRLHHLFEEQVARTPGLIAVRSDESQLSYAELNARANRLARYLMKRGVRPESLIGIYLERSLDLLVAIMGTLKAGAAYVPLDFLSPQNRIALMIEEARPELVLTSERLAQALASSGQKIFSIDSGWTSVCGESAENPAVRVDSENLAYVIYTSGSTGKPKGVMVTHKGLVNYLSWCVRAYYVADGVGAPVHSPVGFDLTVTSLFSPLLVGGAVVMVDEGQGINGLKSAILGDANLSLVKLTPSHLDLLSQSLTPDQAAGRTRAFIIGGESLLEESLKFWRGHAPEIRLINEYGPTETVVGCCCYDASSVESESAAVPIGRPIANTQIYLLGARMQIQALGLEGELYIGGKGVARGYLKMPDLTADRFIPDPFSRNVGARLYRTGDIGCYSPDGNIEFLGRTDDQVKIRGYRIELGEIESVLKQHAGVQDAVVAVKEYSRMDKRLIAYVAPDPVNSYAVRQQLLVDASGEASGVSLYELPNRMRIFHSNKGETEYLYREIFEQDTYLKHGISLNPGDCVFDVGANIGMFTLYASQQCDGLKVYAFEPVPATFDILLRNVELYGINASLFQCGLSDRPGVATFFHYPHMSLMSGRFADIAEEKEIVKRFELNLKAFDNTASGWNAGLLDELLAERLDSELVNCHMRTLSDVIRTEGVERIDLLKIDAEKSEFEILAGIEREDWAMIRQILVEVHDIDGRLDHTAKLLGGHGFQVTTIQERFLKGTNLYVVYGTRPATESHCPAQDGAGGASQQKWQSYEQLIESLRALLREKLPEYMTPAEIELLDRLPMNRNGKVDRQALSSIPCQEKEKRARENRAEQELKRPVEEILEGIWSQVLERKEINAGESFFEQGGHSLLATQVVSRVREIFKIELTLRSIFEAPTVRGLAKLIEAAIVGGDERESLPITSASREGFLPLSFAQQRLWLMDQLEPGTPIYNINEQVRLTSGLDISALNRSITEILRRHEILRTTFVLNEEEPAQVITPPWPVRIPMIDLSEIGVRREEESLRLAREETSRPFNLADGPLFRISLLRLDLQEHIVLLTLHHIVSDGWSMGVFVKELAALYDAFSQRNQITLPELQIQYADFASWQRRWLEGSVLEEQLAYWKRQLCDLPSLDLPSDRPKPLVRTYSGGRRRIAMDESLSSAIRNLSLREGVTLFMTLLAAFKTLLYRYGGQCDIVVGSNIAGRNRKETEKLIGFFVNNLVLRTDLSGNPSFRELLGRVRDVCLNAYAHQDMPFDRLVEELRPERSLSHNPLFQVMFNLHNLPASNLQLSGLTLTPLNIHTSLSRFDLVLNAWEAGSGIVCSMEYSADLFNDATIVRMLVYFQLLLKEVAADPDQPIDDITLMTNEDADEMITAFNEI